MTSSANSSGEKHHGAKGRVHSIKPQYGFIEVDSLSINGRVYFNNRSFEDNLHTDLPSSGLKVGDRVILDFSQRPDTSLYHATSVRRQNYTPQRYAPKLPQRFDNEDGFVCVLKDTHAFARVTRFPGVTASFQKSDFEAYAGRRVVSLADVMELGLKVRFDAERNLDERSKTKWLVQKLRFVDGVPSATTTTSSLTDDGDAAASQKLVGRRGSVEKVSVDHAIVRHGLGTAYLHASVIEKCLGADIEDLRDELQEGSVVLFDADSNGRQYGRGKWCVTRVEILSWNSDTVQPGSLAVAAEEAPATRLRAAGQYSDAADDIELHELKLEPRLHTNGNNRDFNDGEEVEGDVTGACISRNVSDDEFTLVPALASHDEFPSLPSHAPKDEPSVSIYQDVPAVVANVTASSASCLVEQPDRTRTVNFAAPCFYRNGVPVSGNLRRELGGGDLVTLDFMVGTTKHGGEIVHCDLAWQGKKPRNVSRMSAEEMLQRLEVGEVVDEDDHFLHERIDDDDLDALLGESSSTADYEEVDAAPNRRWCTRNDVQETGPPTVAPPKNGTQATAQEEALRYLLTSNEIPVFARMILQQLAASHLPNNRVSLRHASTQTEEF